MLEADHGTARENFGEQLLTEIGQQLECVPFARIKQLLEEMLLLLQQSAKNVDLVLAGVDACDPEQFLVAAGIDNFDREGEVLRRIAQSLAVIKEQAKFVKDLPGSLSSGPIDSFDCIETYFEAEDIESTITFIKLQQRQSLNKENNARPTVVSIKQSDASPNELMNDITAADTNEGASSTKTITLYAVELYANVLRDVTTWLAECIRGRMQLARPRPLVGILHCHPHCEEAIRMRLNGNLHET